MNNILSTWLNTKNTAKKLNIASKLKNVTAVNVVSILSKKKLWDIYAQIQKVSILNQKKKKYMWDNLFYPLSLLSFIPDSEAVPLKDLENQWEMRPNEVGKYAEDLKNKELVTISETYPLTVTLSADWEDILKTLKAYVSYGNKNLWPKAILSALQSWIYIKGVLSAQTESITKRGAINYFCCLLFLQKSLTGVSYGELQKSLCTSESVTSTLLWKLIKEWYVERGDLKNRELRSQKYEFKITENGIGFMEKIFSELHEIAFSPDE